MTTARDIISGAYRRLGLLPIGAGSRSGPGSAGLAAYNDMLNGWAADGIFPGGPNPPSPGTDGLLLTSNFADGVATAVTAGGYPPMAQAIPRRRQIPDRSCRGLERSFPLPAQFVEGAKAILAVDLRPRAGSRRCLDAKTGAEGLRAMLAYYVISPRAGQDTGLTWMPSLRRYGFR